MPRRPQDAYTSDFCRARGGMRSLTDGYRRREADKSQIFARSEKFQNRTVIEVGKYYFGAVERGSDSRNLAALLENGGSGDVDARDCDGCGDLPLGISFVRVDRRCADPHLRFLLISIIFSSSA